MNSVEKRPEFHTLPLCEARLGIFAKAPVPGKVKTRLTPPLTALQAAAIYETALHETVARMVGAGFSVVLLVDGDDTYFARNFPDLPRLSQGEGDLGARMARALEGLLRQAPKAALIGSDAPDLPTALVEEAFTALDSHTVVTAPAADGGYVLIGEREHAPTLFREIPWSSAEVLPLTRARAAQARLAYTEVAGWEDLDDVEALRRLLRRSPSSQTARYLVQNLSALLSPLPLPADS